MKAFRHACAFVTAATAIFAVPGLTHADDFHSKLFGHDIVLGASKDSQQQLQVDGKVLVKDYLVDIEDIRTIDGVGVAIGSTSDGGNACDASYFVVSFSEGQPARVDGPEGNCFAITYSIDNKGITFSTPATVTQSGKTWSWSPKTGMSQKTPVKFDEGALPDGWAELKNGKISHPGLLFKYRALDEQLNALLGTDRESALPIFDGVGGTESKGDVVLATSCAPHDCDRTGALIAIDIAQKKMFLAWKPADAPIVVRPPVKEWPAAERKELAEWAKPWTGQ